MTDYGFDTRAVRDGQLRTMEQEHAEPIFTTSSYVFDSARKPLRDFPATNPAISIRALPTRPCAPLKNGWHRWKVGKPVWRLHRAWRRFTPPVLACCKPVIILFHQIVSLAVRPCCSIITWRSSASKPISSQLTDLQAWEKAIRPTTRMLFLETPSNPLTKVADIKALADLAHAHNCLLVVDNCFCTPALQLPLQLGADIVIHSATKYLDGQGRCIGGAVVGNEDLVGKEVYGFLRTCGPSMSPFNAWVFLKGLETLSIRMRAHCDNAQRLAEWLQQQSAVERVYYPGLADHPQHELAAHQQTGFGGIVSFDVKGGRAAAWKVIDATSICSITANLGDTKTTITHPATTTHGRLTPDQRQEAGISDGLVRIAVGLEDIQDLCKDLAVGLC